MNAQPRSRASLLTAIGSAVIVLVAILIVVVVQRRRAATNRESASGSMANMPGMEGMPGMAPASGASGTVTITAAQQRQLGVTFASVEMRSLAIETRATGLVTFDETRLAQVAPKFSGFVENLYVNATGQPVARGQALLDIYSPDVLAAEQELLVAQQLGRSLGRSAVPGVPADTVDLAAAARRRLTLWDISPAQIDEVIRTGRVRRTVTLYSAAAGVVTVKNVVQGQSIAAGQTLYAIADLAEVWIDVQLRESDASAARVGSGADVEVTGLPGRPFKGRVGYIYPTLDTATRAVRARIVVSNTGGALKPGMYATVRLHAPTRSVLSVPTSAVLRTGTRNDAFVDLGSGRLMPVDIELGQIAGDYTEVLSGLEPGQRVVTSAQFLLDSESNLGEVMRSMISQMPSSPAGGKR